jgi:hypothetical protein
VLREHPPETVGVLDRPRRIERDVVGVGVLREDVARHEKMRAQAKLLGNLAADGDVIAGDHLDRKAEFFRLRDRHLGVGPRRIEQRQESQQCPVLSVIDRAGDAERPGSHA